MIKALDLVLPPGLEQETKLFASNNISVGFLEKRDLIFFGYLI
jgi:hypothetical protein